MITATYKLYQRLFGVIEAYLRDTKHPSPSVILSAVLSLNRTVYVGLRNAYGEAMLHEALKAIRQVPEKELEELLQADLEKYLNNQFGKKGQ